MNVLSEKTCQTIQRLVQQEIGICLKEQKEYLIHDRLLPVATQHGFTNIDGMVQALSGSAIKPELARDIAEALCTHETLFFRDKVVFDDIAKRLREMHAKLGSATPLRIWSAACSTGQEAYSLAICWQEMVEAGEVENVPLEIVGTDVARQALAIAKEGKYTAFEVERGLTSRCLHKHFDHVGNMWQVNENIRKMVAFREHNLLQPFSAPSPFDIVFCRNVLIYFDAPTQQQVIQHLLSALRSGGYLVTGSAEYLHEWSSNLAKTSPRSNIFVRDRRVMPRMEDAE